MVSLEWNVADPAAALPEYSFRKHIVCEAICVVSQ